MPEQGNPTQLKSAVVFGALYALVLLGLAAAKHHIGAEGLYVVAGLSGLTDMDAITLSTVQLIKAERLSTDIGWRMILVGAMSTLFFKACAVGVLGNRALFVRIAFAFGLSCAGGVVLFAIWP